ncbi:hypothetical protein GR183_21445 [Stappia sp. GBMRC 2046]|uniref:Uncharacterized protein n=1 Tax=Stappia sediminis TaxID=2692190 RepID=A0A7X3LYJ2_9HYPH|nr:hypothetical protein [Stappia sediminis]MXN67479.1 hypothetical protein [Stappia sediminis]
MAEKLDNTFNASLKDAAAGGVITLTRLRSCWQVAMPQTVWLRLFCWRA